MLLLIVPVQGDGDNGIKQDICAGNRVLRYRFGTLPGTAGEQCRQENRERQKKRRSGVSFFIYVHGGHTLPSYS